MQVTIQNGQAIGQLPLYASDANTADDPSKTASISGTVSSASTGSPLRQAHITLVGLGQPQARRGAVTDDGGHFSIENILPGEYALSAQHTDYVEQQYGQDKPGKLAEKLALAAGQKIDDLTFHLQKSAVITGHVYDEVGDPIENADVEVMRMTYVRGKRQLVGQRGGSSNDQGEYRIFGLNPGRYYVTAVHGNGGFMNMPTEGEVVYPPMFYPNGDSPDRATEIDLKAGDEISDVDFHLTPNASKGYEVSGKLIGVTATKGSAPISVPMVSLQKTTTSDMTALWFNGQQMMANPTDQTFRFANVSPGTYRLSAVQNENGQRKVAIEDLVVSSTNVTNLTLVLTPGADISGRVTLEGKAVGAGQQLGVRLQSVSADDSLSGIGTQIQGDGSFTLKNVPDGSYKLDVWSSCGTCYVKSVTSQNGDLLDTAFDVRGGIGPASIDIVYSANTAEVSGTVNGDDNKALGGPMVIAVPTVQTPNRETRYKTSTTDQYGHFDLEGLAPGDYDLIALTSFDNESEEYMDPAFLQPYAGKTQRLTVAANDRKSLQLAAVAASSDSP